MYHYYSSLAVTVQIADSLALLRPNDLHRSLLWRVVSWFQVLISRSGWDFHRKQASVSEIEERPTVESSKQGADLGKMDQCQWHKNCNGYKSRNKCWTHSRSHRNPSEGDMFTSKGWRPCDFRRKRAEIDSGTDVGVSWCVDSYTCQLNDYCWAWSHG